jgi:hypothetical protein
MFPKVLICVFIHGYLLVVLLISFDDFELILLVNSWTLDLDDFH